MKRLVLLAVVFMMVLLCGCGITNTKSKTVALNKTELELCVGESFTLKLSGADEPEWSCSNDKVARVFYGAVTALSVGECDITAKANGKSYVCKLKVTVEEEEPAISDKKPDEASKENTLSKVESKPYKQDDKPQVSDKEDNAQKNEQVAEEFMRKGIYKKIDEEYDKLIADFTVECDENINEIKLHIDSKKREIERLNNEAPKKGDLIYGEQLAELETQLESFEKIKKDGIDTYNRRRAEDKENWRDRVLEID